MKKLNIAFDIDDTLYKIEMGEDGHALQVPDHELIAVLKWFHANGHNIFVWSAGGVDYAKTIATKLGVGKLVRAVPKSGWNDGFAPPMDIAFDDQETSLAQIDVRVLRDTTYEDTYAG